MTRLRPLLAALLVALPLAALPAVGVAVWRAGWAPGFADGRCWASVCVLTGTAGNRYTEISWAEYPPPQPATVPVGGAPLWGAPASTVSYSYPARP